MEVNKIYNEDCLETMKRMPNDFIDMTLTSPPYNTGNHSLGYHPNSKTGDKFYDRYDDNLPIKEYRDFLFSVIKECLRVSRYVFWNMQVLSGNKDIFIDILQEFRYNVKDFFIWEKQAVSQIVKGRMAKGYEFIICFGKDNGMTFEYNNFPENGYVPNIKTWYKKGNETNAEHHATFPEELAGYFIQNFTNEGDLIYDPMIGSGTTGKMAVMLKRNYIGSEISAEYTKLAEDRIKSISNPLF